MKTNEELGNNVISSILFPLLLVDVLIVILLVFSVKKVIGEEHEKIIKKLDDLKTEIAQLPSQPVSAEKCDCDGEITWQGF